MQSFLTGAQAAAIAKKTEYLGGYKWLPKPAVVFLCGKGGLGKSMVALNLMDALTVGAATSVRPFGEPLPEDYEPVKGLYIEAEKPGQTAQRVISQKLSGDVSEQQTSACMSAVFACNETTYIFMLYMPSMPLYLAITMVLDSVGQYYGGNQPVLLLLQYSMHGKADATG